MSLTFERVYDATVEDLWALWTTKDGLEAWFAPEGYRVDIHALEVRAGGAFVHEMTAEREDQIAYLTGAGRPRSQRVNGSFVEVVPHERLHLRMTVDFMPGVAPHPIDIEVTFTAAGARAQMVVKVGGHPDFEIERLAGVAMTGQLRNFELAARPGLLTFALNLTLDGCCDHRAGIPDDDLLDHFTALIGQAGAMLYGRTTYEMMESAWPAIARDPSQPRAMRDWAIKLEAMPKYVVSSTRSDFPWENSFHLSGDLKQAVTQLKAKTPRGVLVGSPMLSAALERLGLIDEYHLVVHPVIAGHGPRVFPELDASRRLEAVSTKRLKSGVTATHYRRGN